MNNNLICNTIIMILFISKLIIYQIDNCNKVVKIIHEHNAFNRLYDNCNLFYINQI